MDTLACLVDEIARRGEKTALLLLDAEGEQRVSCAQLAGRAREISRILIASGIARGDRVAVFAGAGAWSIAVILGVLEAGAVIVPLDVQLDPDMLERLLQDCGARCLFAAQDHLETARTATDRAGIPLHLLGERPADAAGSAKFSPDLSPDDAAALFYTSGTTGMPKGVPLCQRNLAFQVETVGAAGLVTERDRILLPLPLHHVYPLVIGVLVPLRLGVEIVVPHSLTGPQIVRAVHEGGVTVVVGVPRLYGALYDGITTGARAAGRVAERVFALLLAVSGLVRRSTGLPAGRVLLRSLHRRFGTQLRMLASGGSAIDPGLVRDLQAIGWQVAIGYGLTETAPLLTLNLPKTFRPGSVGQVVPGVQVRVDPGLLPADIRSRQDAPGTIGEVIARGPNVFRGYHARPEETQEAFTPDGWFRTGDMGWFDSAGFLYLRGRVSTMIVTAGGENVQPEEVEAVYDSHPGIAETGVLQKDGALVALIVPDLQVIGPGGDVAGAVREAVARQSRLLPTYKRISAWAVTRESLARTRIGKIRRSVLAPRYEAARQQEDTGRGPAGAIAIADMSDRDRALLENPAARRIWQWLAQRYPDRRLTPDSSPQLDLGVDSLEWLTISLQLRQHAGVELTEQTIVGIVSVRDLLQTAVQDNGTGGAIDPFEHPEEVLSDRQKRWLQPLGPGMRLVGRFFFSLNWAATRALLRVEAHGLEEVPAGGQVVFVPNHVSYLDAFVLATALGFPRMQHTCWAGWTGAAFANPVARFVSRLARAVPIDPERGMVSSMAFAVAVLQRGDSLVWFPEGGRSRTGRLQPFKPGIGLLLERVPAPVVPVVIHGTHQALPVGRFFLRPTRVRVVFGAPLDPQELERRGRGATPDVRIVDGLRAALEEAGAPAGD